MFEGSFTFIVGAQFIIHSVLFNIWFYVNVQSKILCKTFPRKMLRICFYLWLVLMMLCLKRCSVEVKVWWDHIYLNNKSTEWVCTSRLLLRMECLRPPSLSHSAERWEEMFNCFFWRPVSFSLALWRWRNLLKPFSSCWLVRLKFLNLFVTFPYFKLGLVFENRKEKGKMYFSRHSSPDTAET